MTPSDTAIDAKDFDWLIDHYTDHPDEFVQDVLGVIPWDVQRQIISSVFEYKYTAVKTCNAIGKSYIAACVVVAYLMIYPNSIVVTTAPTWRQVTDVLWRYVGTIVKKAKYKLTDAQANQAGLSLDTDWYAVGLSTSRPENFFGYHADRILVVVDEAGGVEEPIFKGVAAITPNVNARVLLIGNPTSPSGTFFDAFNKPELGYNCITVSAFDTPNFTSVGIKNVQDLLTLYTPQNNVPQAEWTRRVNDVINPRMTKIYRDSLIHPSVVYSRYHEWGEDSPAWESLVMGIFPSQADQALIPMDIARAAFGMAAIDKETGKTYAELSGWKIPDGPNRYGQDMARFGSDRNVLTPRRGGWVKKQVCWNKLDLMTSANLLVDQLDVDDPLVRVNIDDTGNGGGTTDRVMQKSTERIQRGEPGYSFRLVPYNMSSKERMADPMRFHDVTSEIYWNLRMWFIRKAIAFEEFDQEMFDELVGRRWHINKSGKIQVESKEEYKERTKGKSPDKSDSLALAFAGEKPDGTYHDVKTKQDDYYQQRREEAERSPLETITGGLDSRY